jgi:uncharacterized protein
VPGKTLGPAAELLIPAMTKVTIMVFHDGELEVQQRAGVRETADEVGSSIADFVPDRAREFLELRRFAVLGTVDSHGCVWASMVTGDPGFISVIDPQTIRLASLPPAGDPLLENLARDSHAALLAVDFLNPRRWRINGRGVIEGGVICIKTVQVYGNCRRYIQERILVGTRQTGAANGGALSRSSALSAAQRDQIGQADTFFIATDHPDNGADVSHKGGDPGFVRLLNARHISYPDYNGNSMFNTLGNITINPHAGLLFIDFNTGRTLQLTGRASVDWSPENARAFAGAERIVNFEIDGVIENDAGFPLIAKFRQFSRFNPKAESN